MFKWHENIFKSVYVLIYLVQATIKSSCSYFVHAIIMILSSKPEYTDKNNQINLNALSANRVK